ncbi:hypothetical protein ABZP36_016948 [Zizania latifolia]
MSLEIDEEDGGAGTAAAKVMSVSGSGKRVRYARQLMGRHNDTDVHVAATATATVAKDEGREALEAARRAVAAEANEAGETPLVAAAERGYLEVVMELLRHLDSKGVAAKNRPGYDALHVAAREGHHGEMTHLELSVAVCVSVCVLNLEL